MLSAKANYFLKPFSALLLCLVLWCSPAAAQTSNPDAGTSGIAGSENTITKEEIIEFKEDDPELIGHLREEKTSYADYEIQNTAKDNPERTSDNSTTAFDSAGGNATPAASATKPRPYEKVVPTRYPQPTAMRLFRYLPPSIFENTIEGMHEDEKQTLMDTGETEFWVLTALTEDELVIENKAPEIDTQATLILFHADNADIIMAMGVSAGDSCALELWKFRAKKGGITPVQMPDEPAVSDFFETNRALPQDTDVSMLICLDPVEKKLIAKPLIWTPSGLDPIVLDNKVIYDWNGKRFVKKVVPLRRAE